MREVGCLPTCIRISSSYSDEGDEGTDTTLSVGKVEIIKVNHGISITFLSAIRSNLCGTDLHGRLRTLALK